MSNLLKEAIVDAKALRESALKNAETIVIEKYSEEVKDTLQKLLEQEDDLGLALPGEEPVAADAGADPLAADPLAAEEPALDVAAEEEPLDAAPAADVEGLADEDIPLGATNDFADLDGQNLGAFVGGGEGQQLTIDLGALQESIEALKQSIDEDEEVDLSEFLSEEDSLDEAAPLVALAPGVAAKGAAALGAAKAAAVPALAGYATGATVAKRDDEEHEDEEDEELEEAKGEKGDADPLDGERAKFDKDHDGVPDGADKDEDDPDVKEAIDTDALMAAIMEKLTVDMGADLAGWAGRRQEDKIYQMEKEMAHRRSTDVEEEMKDLKKAQEELVFENNQLTEKLSEYEAVVGELKEGLQDTNLSNARLLYTNRVLRNTSLNERQKDKIAEAISNAGSVTEAKTIYDTLQSTVEAKPKKSPQSLSEAIGRRNTVLRATRKEEPASDHFQDRMKRLAGIN
tara:strand:- start:60 stop:1433 length:1374 start_codon:yes stop_codon:yes gene_type:complete